MKRSLFAVVVFFASMANWARSQETDVFINVRGDRLHFHILKGSGIPILFEAEIPSRAKVCPEAFPIKASGHPEVSLGSPQ